MSCRLIKTFMSCLRMRSTFSFIFLRSASSISDTCCADDTRTRALCTCGHTQERERERERERVCVCVCVVVGHVRRWRRAITSPCETRGLLGPARHKQTHTLILSVSICVLEMRIFAFSTRLGWLMPIFLSSKKPC